MGASGTRMVDVSSGVERCKGVKDDDLIAGFLAAVAGIGAFLVLETIEGPVLAALFGA